MILNFQYSIVFYKYVKELLIFIIFIKKKK